MSLKPPKASDLNKRWMKERRNKAIKIQPERHLIVTEGEKTEPQYFGAIKDIINQNYRNKIHLDIHGSGNNTLDLFETAQKLAKANPNGYKHVWIVYDTDDFPKERINKTKDMCDIYSNSEIEYHAIWSNQCIELWFLLHFDYFQSDIHRNEYFPKLNSYLQRLGYGVYAKNRKDIFDILRPYMEVAIQNAKKLNLVNEGKLPSDAAPGTKVYELIEILKPYL